MDDRAGEPSVGTITPKLVGARGRLFRKYALLFAVIVSVTLVANGLLDIWFSDREQNALLKRIHTGASHSAATKIGQFVKEIEGQLGWTTQLAWTTANVEQRRLVALRLLRLSS
jgi:two-component system, NtrC family, sensor kinase